jgi:hypothetical protein
MRKTVLGIAAVVMFSMVLGSVSAAEQECKLEFEITADFFSKYIWRGINVGDDYVFQPGFSATYGAFTAGIWGNLEMTNINGQSGEFTEWDFYVDYTTDLAEGVSFSAGFIQYHFPSVVGDTKEVYWGFGFDLPLSPSVTVYHDIDVIDGTYVSVGAGHSFGEIANFGGISVGMDAGVTYGWGDSDYNAGYWAVAESKSNDLVLSLAFPMELADGWSFSASINYAMLMDDTIRETAGGDNDHFFTGLSLAKSF